MPTTTKDTFAAVEGNIGDTLTGTLTGTTALTGTPVITGLIWKRKLGDPQPADPDVHVLTGTLVDPDTRQFTLDLGNATGFLATVATPGEWNLQVVATWPGNARKLTWPNTGYATVVITRKGE